jgi:hypothetical protein
MLKMLFLIKTMTRRDQEKCIKEAQQRPRPIEESLAKFQAQSLLGSAARKVQAPIKSSYKASKVPNPIFLDSVTYRPKSLWL